MSALTKITMGNFKKLFFLIWISALGCSKNERILEDCIDAKLEEHNMVKYEGQKIGCDFFFGNVCFWEQTIFSTWESLCAYNK